MTEIDLFVVPPGEDDEFLAAWREEPRTAVLHRALRDGVEFRFAAIGEGGVPDAEAGCVLIEPFAVPEGEDERFVAGWQRARAAVADQRGYLGTRLHRSVGDSPFRFVSLARWSSPLMFARATQRPEFRAAGAGLPYTAHPALYSVVDA